VLLACCLAASACGTPSSSPSARPATPAAAKTSACFTPPQLSATLRITSPKAGDVVPAGAVTVAFDVTGAELVAFQIAKCPTDYHVHVVLDREVSAYLGTDVAAPLVAGVFHTPFNTNAEPRSVTFSDVAAGQHTAVAWLAFADHTSVRPAVSSSVTFVVR
jgi:hypothetical protein